MNRFRICALMGAALILAPAVAFAAHGKVGLWTVTSTLELRNMPPIPPQTLEMMKQNGQPIPGQPFTTQMCMTQEQVNADKPPSFNDNGESCDTKVLSSSPSAMHTQVVCRGRVNGTGETQISWRGDDHYDGTYSFKGEAEGHPQDMTIHYSGDFVKADCGNVRPYGPPPGR